MTSSIIPEVLSPAGSLEKMKVAIMYGANAVYLAGQKFGLRAAADNFTHSELAEAVEFAHNHQAKVYVVLNSFLHDQDLEQMDEFIEYLNEIKVDALIVSDLGVIKSIQNISKLPIHLSTQASCLNRYSGKLWKKMGVERLILGRECSLEDAKNIKEATGLEIEMFIHGSMCMAYSGNCVISNYTQGRDSNRGGCAHSCRFEYSIQFDEEEKRKHSFFMSSKDLNGLRVLEEYIKAGVDSIKIEGRMKSHLYAGTMSKVYREALDYYREHGNFLSDKLEAWSEELTKVSHRAYAPVNLMDKAGEDTIFNERLIVKDQYKVIGQVLDSVEDDFSLLQVRSAFYPGDTLEIIPFKGESFEVVVDEIFGLDGQSIEKTKPSTLVKIPYHPQIESLNLVRKRLDS
jgi:putative protease